MIARAGECRQQCSGCNAKAGMDAGSQKQHRRGFGKLQGCELELVSAVTELWVLSERQSWSECNKSETAAVWLWIAAAVHWSW